MALCFAQDLESLSFAVQPFDEGVPIDETLNGIDDGVDVVHLHFLHRKFFAAPCTAVVLSHPSGLDVELDRG